MARRRLLCLLALAAGLGIAGGAEAQAPEPTLLEVRLGRLVSRTLEAWRAGDAALLPVGAVLGSLWAWRVVRQRRPRDVARDMLEVAAQVGTMVGCPLVLMGHSHHGTLERLGDVVYANSGSWLDGSHLVVRRDPGGRLVEVELRRWRNDGVTLVKTMRVPHVVAERIHVQAGEQAHDRPAAATGELQAPG